MAANSMAIRSGFIT